MGTAIDIIDITDLLSYYNFDNNVLDQYGSSDIFEGWSSYTFENNSIKKVNATDGLITQNSPTSTTGTGTISISFWYQYVSGNDETIIIKEKTAGFGDGGFSISYIPSTTTLRFRTASQNFDTVIDLSSLTHIVFTYYSFNDALSLYIDSVGGFKGFVSGGRTTSNVGYMMEFLNEYYGSAVSTDVIHLLDELRIYNRLLDTEEIVTLYNAGVETIVNDIEIFGKKRTGEKRPVFNFSRPEGITSYKVGYDGEIYFEQSSSKYIPEIDLSIGNYTLYVIPLNGTTEGNLVTFDFEIVKGGINGMKRMSLGVTKLQYTPISPVAGSPINLGLSKEGNTILAFNEEVLYHTAEQTGNVAVQATVRTSPMTLTVNLSLDWLVNNNFITEEQVDYAGGSIYYGIASKNGCNANSGKLIVHPVCEGISTDYDITLYEAVPSIAEEITYSPEGEALATVIFTSLAVEKDVPTPALPTTATGSGTLAAATYSYKLSAGTFEGYTIPSTATAGDTVADGDDSITVSFVKVLGADRYRMWRTDDGGTTWKYYDLDSADMLAGTVVDDGTLTWTVGIPPSSTTATYYGHYQKGGVAS